MFKTRSLALPKKIPGTPPGIQVAPSPSTEVPGRLGGGLGILEDVESQRVDGGMPTPRSSFRWVF